MRLPLPTLSLIALVGCRSIVVPAVDQTIASGDTQALVAAFEDFDDDHP